MGIQTKYIIVKNDSSRFVANNNISQTTPNINRAFTWSKKAAADNVLKSLKAKKKSPASDYVVKEIIYDTDTGKRTIQKNNESASVPSSPPANFQPVTTPVTTPTANPTNTTQQPTKAPSQIADTIKEVFGDSIHVKEILNLSFYRPKTNTNFGNLSVDAVDTAIEAINVLGDPSVEDFLCEELQKLDLEIIDIEHKIELYNFNAYEGYLLAKNMKEARIRRRKIKDIIAKYDAIKDNGDFIAMKTKIDSCNEKNESRNYTPRIRTDLFDKNKKER